MTDGNVSLFAEQELCVEEKYSHTLDNDVAECHQKTQEEVEEKPKSRVFALPCEIIRNKMCCKPTAKEKRKEGRKEGAVNSSASLLKTRAYYCHP